MTVDSAGVTHRSDAELFTAVQSYKRVYDPDADYTFWKDKGWTGLSRYPGDQRFTNIQGPVVVMGQAEGE